MGVVNRMEEIFPGEENTDFIDQWEEFCSEELRLSVTGVSSWGQYWTTT